MPPSATIYTLGANDVPWVRRMAGIDTLTFYRRVLRDGVPLKRSR
jgi:hypothetical protein